MIAFYATPLIQKYNKDGLLLSNLVYEMPYKTARVIYDKNSHKIKVTGRKKALCYGMDADQEGNIFLITTKRPRNKKEQKVFYISDGGGIKAVFPKDFDPEKSDRFRLIVFNKAGKVIAVKDLDIVCSNLFIHHNRLFIINTFLSKKIYEYLIIHKNK